MNFKEFIKGDGLKKLAMMRLKSSSYSLAIYLFNEIVSGVEEMITSRKELSLVLGLTEKQFSDALDELQFYNIILVQEVAGKPLRIRAQLNVSLWNMVHSIPGDGNTKSHLGDASNVHALHNQDDMPLLDKSIRLVDIRDFAPPIPFPVQKIKNIEDLHGPIDETEQKSSLNDLTAFREKHQEIDAKIKALARHELDVIKAEKKRITQDEELLLQILSEHEHPKKQLILALNSNLVYPNLKFFLDTARMCAEIPAKK